MPSMQIGLVSGGQIIISGNPWSGHISPQGLITFRWQRAASGNVYVGFSGGLTVNSGGFATSGGFAHSGLLDGMEIGPGDVYSTPRIATGLSGNFSVYATPDAGASGNRMYYEVF